MANTEIRENGARVRVETGDTITVRLAQASGAGYEWSTASVDTDAVSVEHDYVVPSSPAPGAHVEHVFVLRALRPGAAEAEFTYARAWETTVPQERFGVHIDVTDTT